MNANDWLQISWCKSRFCFIETFVLVSLRNVPRNCHDVAAATSTTTSTTWSKSEISFHSKIVAPSNTQNAKRKSFKRGRAQIILKCHFDATILLWQGSSYTFAVKIDALSHPVWQELTKLWPPWQLFKVIGLFCCLGKNYSTLSASVQNVLG